MYDFIIQIETLSVGITFSNTIVYSLIDLKKLKIQSYDAYSSNGV